MSGARLVSPIGCAEIAERREWHGMLALGGERRSRSTMHPRCRGPCA